MKPNVISEEVLVKIFNDANDNLASLVKYEFQPYEGIYRINDCGDYVSAQDWDNYWGQFPDWHEKAWIVSDNGQYGFRQVAAMTIPEVEAAYDSPDFEAKYVFYTEADESGMC